jgi:hypothetical protein
MAELEVVPQGVFEDDTALLQQGGGGEARSFRPVADRAIAEQDLAGVGVFETEQQAGETGLAAAAGADDGDVLAGLEAGMETFLVLTGLTGPDEVDRYPFRPSTVADSIADLVDRI